MAPVFVRGERLSYPKYPPHTIILEPVQTAVWRRRAAGAPAVLVGVHESVAGSYAPPVFVVASLQSDPPQTILLDPVHAAVGKLYRAGGAPAVVVAFHESAAGS